MVNVETWPEYVRRIAGDMKQEDISALTGISQTTVSSWLRGAPGLPRAESVIAFARAYEKPPVEALVAAGYLDGGEAAAKVRTPLSEYSNRELVGELSSRLSKESKQT